MLGTVGSVLAQTWRDLELIVVDDGSTDRTVERLAAVADPRLRVFSQGQAAGVSAARNRGMAEAGGELLAFLDADDWWTPGKLIAQVRALDASPEAGVAYSWTRFVDARGRERYRQAPVAFEGYVYPDILVSNFTCSGSNILVRRRAAEASGGFDPTLLFAEDWEYCVRLAARSRFALVRQHDVLYRQAAGSRSAVLASDPGRWEREGLRIIEAVFATVPAGLQALKRRRVARFYLHMAHRMLDAAPRPRQAWPAGARLWRAIRHDPALALDPTTQRVLARWLLQTGGLVTPAGRPRRGPSGSSRA